MPKNKFKIKCYCGNIGLDLLTNKSSVDLPRRKCQCDFCIAHGAVWTSDPKSGEVEVKIKDKNKINKYRFGTKTADYYVCTNCGIVPITVSNIDNNDYAVVNINAITEPKIIIKEVAKTNFSDENTENRLKRRKKNWTNKVRINLC